MDAALRESVQQYTSELLKRSIGDNEFRTELERVLSSPGFVLSAAPRSLLAVGVQLCYKLVGGEAVSRVVPAAAAIDLVFSSIEFIDKALDDEDITGHSSERWDANRGLNAASCLQALAFQALDDLLDQGFSDKQVRAAQQDLASIISETAAGQYFDLLYESVQCPTFEESLRMTELKAGPLVSSVGTLGARLGSSDRHVADALATFGRNTGTFAQIVNDLTDSTSREMHKSDIRRRKKTLPIVYLLTRGDEFVFGPQQACLRGERFITSDQEAKIKAAIISSGAVEFATAIAEAYRLKAFRALGSLQDWFDTSEIAELFLGTAAP